MDKNGFLSTDCTKGCEFCVVSCGCNKWNADFADLYGSTQIIIFGFAREFIEAIGLY